MYRYEPRIVSPVGTLKRASAPGAVAMLIAEGYDPVFGARPLKRVIQQRLENPLATRLLSGEFAPGDRVRAEAGGGTIIFTKT